MSALPYTYNDGGRALAGFKGSAGDCVTRSIAIVAELPYADVYAALAAGTGAQRASKGVKRGASARAGINTGRKWFKDYMRSLGFEWTPTMAVGIGCKVHLVPGEVPMVGRLIVAVSKHYTTVIDGVINDTHNPSRQTLWIEAGKPNRTSHRCVYGYWRMNHAR